MLPSQVLDLSQGEVTKLIEKGTEKYRAETRKFATLLAVIYNSPMCYKKDDETPWTADDMIKEDVAPEDEELYQIALARISAAKAQRMG